MTKKASNPPPRKGFPINEGVSKSANPPPMAQKPKPPPPPPPKK